SKLVKEYELSHRNRIYEWRDKVKQGGYEGLMDDRGKKTTQVSSKNKQDSEIDEKAKLTEEIRLLQLKNEYLSKLIGLERG
ncbi:hypothetical protein, partial [Virgibacillus sp. DJP39]|uniref:hypothetical protein n=1 Tax=Virgibacillus sp. DJP39 TaxID=3409790 RepID=UPI003BB48F00